MIPFHLRHEPEGPPDHQLVTVHVGGGGQAVGVSHHEPRARRDLRAREANGDLRQAALDVSDVPALHLFTPELRGEDLIAPERALLRQEPSPSPDLQRHRHGAGAVGLDGE